MHFIFLIKNQHSLIKGLLLMLAMSLPLILRTSSWKLNLDTHVGIFWNISVLCGKRETEYFISEYAWKSELWPHFCQHERRRGDGLLGIWSDSLQQCPGALPFPIFFSFFFLNPGSKSPTWGHAKAQPLCKCRFCFFPLSIYPSRDVKVNKTNWVDLKLFIRINKLLTFSSAPWGWNSSF